jgi:hypothetical protein
MLPAFPDPTTYDEAARYLLGRAGAGVFAWLLRLGPDRVRFDGWIQNQLTVPGVKQRLCDGIARLADLDRGGVPFAALVEIQTRPDATMPGRLLLAGGLCLLTLKPTPLPGDRYELAAVVVNLTGEGDAARRMALGATQWTLVPCEWNVEPLDAGTLLDEIAAGRVPREVLALIPLMKRGSEDAIIARWLAVAASDGDASRRGDYSLALVFSEAVKSRHKWEIALKGFNMIESPLVREWKDAARNEGRIEGKLEGRIEGQIVAKADSVVRVVNGKFKVVAPEVVTGIRACQDLEQLDRWLDVALTVETIDEFRKQTGL